MFSKTKENDWGLILKIVPYAKRNSSILLLSLILLIPLAASGAIQPLIVGQAISLLRKEPTWSFLDSNSISSGLNLLAIILLSTIIIRTLFQAWQGFLVQKVGQEITAFIRQDLFDHVTSLSSNFFHKTPVGKLVTRITNDVEALGDVFATGAIGILSDVVYILAIIVTIFTLQWQLASLLVFLLIPVTGLIIYFQKQYRKANYTAREELSVLNSMLQENVMGINVVQLFQREKYNSELFRTVNERYRIAIDKTIFHDSAVSATLEWISLVAIAAVLWIGGIFILQDSLTFGILSAFILYAQRLFDPLRQFADKFTMFQSGFTAIERISELMNIPVEIQDRHDNISFDENADQGKVGEIRFENVSFAYKPDEYILKNLNFTINPGEKIAIVGPTGAGKSSIIRLLCRLYEPNQGRILVDGIDIRDITQAELRRHIGVILQESFIFAGDVRRNITLGEEYSLTEIEEAAKVTNVDRFIRQLPDGYDTILRERGANLSGGQKQLLAFARVAIRNPNILVLDEATSSLDVATEADTQEALEKLLVGKTAIIIAHRLSTIRNVDKILVLKQGELIESGSHDQLLAQNGIYAGLYKLQMLGS
ncbi:ABC transporter ATP-binding protein [Cyanobacterium aponinum UTEX 3222]|uniref:Xenobiotic-transporting ATPase n=1 Tax=Cyanobacterium aponinum (strain PCC 10605) TaxID=755178 RepID=K9Z2X8_CYAAP|nr:ABC transporter ATP-binding protein [Cyanobacterium aponinum]AFZ52703.1 Xenobiotic-transporting ATPase [Cyanobacterium aponinum PCC 10605]PHV61979.1 ABC transporter ATP-binding protein [Cyanobacterium aponinum IPPAS B-1201]WRL39061.1 ABC transporter ATP-binding protein [Cyanobacterium aponinum UTEX 3221]WRL40631.1 ABC transporter ATP-binding protein [Cyanobacterium aponinum UTEX 3222]